MIAPMGLIAIASYSAIFKLERFAFISAISFAQVLTFLVSNKLGERDSEGAKNCIKKVLILSAFFVFLSLLILCFNANYVMSFFDKKGEFTPFAVSALIPISMLVIFDFVQIILASALRGAGDVQTVMWGRFGSCMLFFVPVSWFVSKIAIGDPHIKFILIYSCLYLATGLMGIIFLLRIKSKKWDKRKV
jgi:Na+-driven multidrug efflux pump